jgi:hypothetical protein
MEKPIKTPPIKLAYHWNQVEDYIKFKTGKDIRDWSGKYGANGTDLSRPYQDMWHWLVYRYDLHNGCYFCLDISDESISWDDTEHLFIKEILAVLREEFPGDIKTGMNCWVSW